VIRFCADQNIPGDAVAALRPAGHDVLRVEESSPGASDKAIIASAVTEARVLPTFDKDFGELAFHSKLPATCGVVLFRIPMPRSDAVGARIAALLSLRDDWAGRFSVIEPGRVRMRELPSAG